MIEKYCLILYRGGVTPLLLRSACLVSILMLCATCEPRGPSSPSVLVPPPAPEANVVKSSGNGENAVTGEFLRAQIQTLSSDQFEGRGPGTRGDQAARAYLEEQLQALSLTPLPALRGWEQAVELVGVKAAMPKAWAFEHGSHVLRLAWWDQYIAGSGVQGPVGELSRAELVFVGYGIEAPEYHWDDFKGQDVRGKVLLVLNNDPDWDPALFAGSTRLYYGRWTYKYENAARHGAAGVIIIHTTPSAGYPFSVVQSSWGGEQFSLPSAGSATLQVKAWVTEEAAQALVALSGHALPELVAAARTPAFVPVQLGITTSLHFTNQVQSVHSANVLAAVTGSDPKLKSEYIVLSAHHDHLGIGKPDATGDAIYNGAEDNASGLAQVLAIAKALKAAPTPPRRSVLVLFPAAEESGLLGSQYFVENLPIPAAKLVANLNYDGGNIWGRTRDITQIGQGKSSLDEIVARIAAQQGRIVKTDQFPDRGTFYRSDQFNFAKLGVPALYLKTGTDFIGRPEGWGKTQILSYEANHYHQPSDQLTDAWNFDGMVEDARFGFLAALAIANTEQAPTWVAGDEFEAARKASLRVEQ
jgi:Zn-dependent M28 family amino/carboxypeptidase